MTLTKKRNYSLERKQMFVGYLFMAPNFIGFLIFTFLPVLFALILSFTNWDGFTEIKFIGLQNYINLLSDETFKISFKNNIIFTSVSVPLKIVFSLMLAIALNRKMKGIIAFRAIYFLPYISAIVAVAVVWQALFHPEFGPINEFLRNIGISNPPKWLSSTKWAMAAVISTSTWKYSGYTMVLFLAGLQSIPKQLYEAANIDGANAWRKFWNITLPVLSPTMFFVSIIQIINSFKVFEVIYIMTEGGPARATYVLVYNIYIEAFEKFNIGYASSMAYVFFVIILTITIIQFKGQKKWVNYM